MVKNNVTSNGNGRVRSPFEQYLADINETDLLNADEERELGRSIQSGDAGARERMIRANLRLVVSIAKGYVGKGVLLEDLVEEGNLGLMTAVGKFDPEYGTRFSTYATYWIEQAIQRGLENQKSTVRVPAYIHELIAKWNQTGIELEKELHRPASSVEIGARLNLKTSVIRSVRQGMAALGLANGSGTEEGERSHLEYVAADDENPLGTVVHQELLSFLPSVLKELDEREQSIMSDRFGLNGTEPLTLKEVGLKQGITRERVRQIERDVLQKLRRQLQGEI